MFRFNYQPSEYTAEEIFLPACALYELLVADDPYACIQGTIFLMDMSKATLSHFLQLSLSFFKIMVSYFEKALPQRIKGIYYFNIPPTAHHFFKMLLPLFSEKLRKRVRIIISLS